MAQFQTEIVWRTGFLKPFLWNNQDSVMADRGFVMSDELKKLCVALYIPCEAFIQTLSTAIFPQRFSFFTIYLVQGLRGVALW